MYKLKYVGYPIIVSLFLQIPPANASNIDYFHTGELEPSDYLLGSNSKAGDPIFDRYRTVDLNVDIGIGSDCGRISIKDTMQAALKNILDTKYLGDMGSDIMAASPMLLTCYFSPTWCAILKHSRIRANFLAQLRLNQCRAINRFVDQRVSDYYESRSSCIQDSIKKHNGNFERAMESCQNYRAFDIRDWSGDGDSTVNKLIESTAKWAKMTDDESQRIVDLTKSFVGDTVIQRGEVSIDFGPRRVQLTPRTYLMEVRNSIFERLCKGILSKVVRSGGYRANVYRVISNDELQEVSGSNQIKIDHQTILSLAYMPRKKRVMACKRLSDALAMGIYTEDMGKTLDFISSKMVANPHLPEKRKAEVDLKRRAFKDHVELTLDLAKENSEPLNKVLFQINSDGRMYINEQIDRNLDSEQGAVQAVRAEEMFFDCGDGIGCDISTYIY